MDALLPRVIGLRSTKESVDSRSPEINVCRAALRPAARRAYDELLPQMRQGVVKASVRAPCTMENAQDAYVALVSDHPELFWLNNRGFVGCKTIQSNGNLFVEPHQALSGEERNRTWRRMQEVIRVVSASAPARASDYDLCRHVYEWICTHVTYNRTAPRGQTAVGALVDRRAVCAGIAGAYSLILRALGVPCGCVSGSDAQGDGHRWNIVRLDKSYSFVDCANGRLNQGLSLFRADKPALTYRFLCFNTPELLRRYSLAEGQSVPICISRTHDWFVRNGMMMASVFAFEQLDACLCSANANGKRAIEVKFGSRRAYRDGVKAARNGDVFLGRFGELLSATASRPKVSIGYSHDDAMRTLLISW